ncbi:MAG: peptidoglycan-binding protein [Ilumatobacteraceae bacterium]
MRTFRWALAALTGIVAFGGVVAASDPEVMDVDQGATSSGLAVRSVVPESVLVIGDSSAASLRWVPGAATALRGATIELDLESCRRLVERSCRGREGRVPSTALEALSAHGDVHTTLVMATGYNDTAIAHDGAVSMITQEAARLGYERVIWLTLRSDVDYVSPSETGNHREFAAANRVLARRIGSDMFGVETLLANWGGYSADHPEWFTADGVHHRSRGAWAFADYVSRVLAHADGRACPTPDEAFTIPDDPCPDPDATGAIADIAGLYPVVDSDILCYEIGPTRAAVCARDTHVIAMGRELGSGDVGDDVEALQVRLSRIGYPVSPATGNYLELTAAAVTAFQSANGLEPSGRADRATLVALGFEVSF